MANQRVTADSIEVARQITDNELRVTGSMIEVARQITDNELRVTAVSLEVIRHFPPVVGGQGHRRPGRRR